jgi:hypothetical protein
MGIRASADAAGVPGMTVPQRGRHGSFLEVASCCWGIPSFFCACLKAAGSAFSRDEDGCGSVASDIW